jgi:hypothetical protein
MKSNGSAANLFLLATGWRNLQSLDVALPSLGTATSLVTCSGIELASSSINEKASPWIKR